MSEDSGRAQSEPGLWRHCMECSVLVTVGTLVLSIALPHSVGTWFLVTCSAVVTAGLFYVPLARIGSVPVAVYLGAWGAVVTAWLAAARILGPWHADVLAGLILPSLALAMLGPVAIGSHLNAADRDAKARDRLQQREEQLSASGRPLLARLGVDGVKVLDVVEHASGRQVHGRLGRVTEDGPRPGTLSQLRDVTDLIAQDQRLHAGAVSVEQPPGTSSAEFVLHLNELTGLRGRSRTCPPRTSFLTVNRALGLALRDDGREWSLKIREINVLIAGVTGSGKSNLMQVFIAQLSRCVDVIIFMIDLKGGRARPGRGWSRGSRGSPKRPVIDWLATTPEEANLMLEARCGASREDRSRSGAGGEKIHA